MSELPRRMIWALVMLQLYQIILRYWYGITMVFWLQYEKRDES